MEEKEFVKIKKVFLLNRGEAIHLEMVISEGKFIALVNALSDRQSVVAQDLLILINRAENG